MQTQCWHCRRTVPMGPVCMACGAQLQRHQAPPAPFGQVPPTPAKKSSHTALIIAVVVGLTVIGIAVPIVFTMVAGSVVMSRQFNAEKFGKDPEALRDVFETQLDSDARIYDFHVGHVGSNVTAIDSGSRTGLIRYNIDGKQLAHPSYPTSSKDDPKRCTERLDKIDFKPVKRIVKRVKKKLADDEKIIGIGFRNIFCKKNGFVWHVQVGETSSGRHRRTLPFNLKGKPNKIGP